MINKEFQAVASPCGVTVAELEEINKLTVKQLAADEVYTFRIILCDNEIDRDCERFDIAALEKMAELFVGVTGIFDHNPGSGNQTARIFSTECERVTGKFTSYGDEYVCLRAKAYMPRTAKNADLIAEIDAGIKKEVSVSCAVGSFSCSICGQDIRHGGCSHKLGEEYDSKTCCCVLSDIKDAYEWSFVAIPAQVNAGVTKSYLKEDESMESCLKAIKSGAAVKMDAAQSKQLANYIERLEKEAEDGKLYRDRLTKEAVKYALLSVPELTTDTVKKMCGGVETAELVKIRDAFKEKAAEALPLAPQTKAKKNAAVTDNSEYLF